MFTVVGTVVIGAGIIAGVKKALDAVAEGKVIAVFIYTAITGFLLNELAVSFMRCI